MQIIFKESLDTPTQKCKATLNLITSVMYWRKNMRNSKHNIAYMFFLKLFPFVIFPNTILRINFLRQRKLSHRDGKNNFSCAKNDISSNFEIKKFDFIYCIDFSKHCDTDLLF